MGKCISINRNIKKKLCRIIIIYLIVFFLCYPSEIIHIHSTIIKYNLKEENLIHKPLLIYLGEFLLFIPELIYNKSLNLKDIIKELPKIFILCFLLIINDFCEILNQILMIKQNSLIYVDKILFLPLFLIFFCCLFFKMKFYRHQYLSMIFISLSSFIRLIFQCEKLTNLINISLEIFMSLLVAITYILINDLLKKQYFSPFKVCSLIGFINSITILSIYLFSSYFPCKNNFFCNFICNDSYYFDNIKCFIKYLPLFYKIFSPFLIILYGLKKYLINLVINEYSILEIIFFIILEDSLGINFITTKKKYFYYFIICHILLFL